MWWTIGTGYQLAYFDENDHLRQTLTLERQNLVLSEYPPRDKAWTGEKKIDVPLVSYWYWRPDGTLTGIGENGIVIMEITVNHHGLSIYDYRYDPSIKMNIPGKIDIDYLEQKPDGMNLRRYI